MLKKKEGLLNGTLSIKEVIKALSRHDGFDKAKTFKENFEALGDSLLEKYFNTWMVKDAFFQARYQASSGGMSSVRDKSADSEVLWVELLHEFNRSVVDRNEKSKKKSRW